MLRCTGCGSTQTIEQIRREHPAAISCCPERDMRDDRTCTCFPDDWPPHIPCQHKYAFKDCAIEAIRQNLAMIK